jgi:hypothetical protein
MLKVATDVEVQALELPRPAADVDQLEWRLGIERAAEAIEMRLKGILQADEIKFKIREGKATGDADTREMSVSVVETRLQQIQKARDKISQPSMASVFQNGEGSSSVASGAGIQGGKYSKSGSKSSSNKKMVQEASNSKKKE